VPSSHTLTAYAPVVPLPAALLEAVLSSPQHFTDIGRVVPSDNVSDCPESIASEQRDLRLAKLGALTKIPPESSLSSILN